MPQTQQYCSGRFSEWDPKITTLPGLYILGGAYARLLDSLGQPWALGDAVRRLNPYFRFPFSSLRGYIVF